MDRGSAIACQALSRWSGFILRRDLKQSWNGWPQRRVSGLVNRRIGKLSHSGRERRYRLLSMIGLGVVLCLSAYYVVFSANGLMVYREKRQTSQELDRQIKALQQQNSAMEQEIKALKTDPKTIEKEARERLHYTRPGEVVYSLPTAPAAPSPAKK